MGALAPRAGGLALILAAICWTASASASPTIAEYPVPTHNRQPLGIAAGPDGNVWYVQSVFPGGIGRSTLTGEMTEFTSGLSGAAQGIAAGPDGNLWFTEPGAEKIGRITPTGTITEFSPAKGSKPAEITAGPEGDMWFTESGNPGAIGRITPAGSITEFTSGLTKNSQPNGIAAGPEGDVWFTESANPGAIGRITPAGSITEFTTGLTKNSDPEGITAGPEGNLWFTEAANPGAIGRITPTGTITEFTTGLTPNAGPHAITSANDGNIYFTETHNPGEIGRITPAGAITERATPTTSSQPEDITTGPDGNLWFTEAANPGKIAIMTVAPEVSATSASSVAEQSTTLQASVGPNSQATTYYFEYGTTTSYGSSTPSTSAGSGAGSTLVSSPVSGLSPTTGYHFRTVATNATGTTYGPDQTFTTITAPTAITQPAIAVTATSGTLNGTVNPEGQATAYHFEWGETTSYGDQTSAADESVGADTSAHPLEQSITGLSPDRTYHFRIVASNCGGCAEGTVYGADQSLTTTSPPVVLAGIQAPFPGSASPFPADPDPASPALGRTAVAKVLAGTVFVKAPGATAPAPLSATGDIPMGSLVNATYGTVLVTTASDQRGDTQSAHVWAGSFVIRQTPSDHGMTTFTLPAARPSGCQRRAGQSGRVASDRVASDAASGGKKSAPSLWASDHDGHFSTRGQNSVATVRGTYWGTVERCDGTLTIVRRGLVSVRSLRGHGTVLVRAGHSYLARL